MTFGVSQSGFWLTSVSTMGRWMEVEPSAKPPKTRATVYGIRSRAASRAMTEATISIHIRNSTATFVDMVGLPATADIIRTSTGGSHLGQYKRLTDGVPICRGSDPTLLLV
jgi:hypothetical protein